MAQVLVTSRVDTADSAMDRRLELCGLCGRKLLSIHRHLFHRESHSLLCACPVCALRIEGGARQPGAEH